MTWQDEVAKTPHSKKVKVNKNYIYGQSVKLELCVQMKREYVHIFLVFSYWIRHQWIKRKVLSL